MKRILLAAACLSFAINGFGQAFDVKPPYAGKANYGALRFKPGTTYHDYLMRYVYQFNEQRQQQLATAVRKKTSMMAYARDARERLKNIAGPMPERTPLHAKVTGTVSGEGFRVEKVIFQSAPGRYVTAHLYLPEKISKPVPACVEMCGHGLSGKGNGSMLAVRMALQGMAVIVVDPIAQGERLQLIDHEGHALTRGVTTEHTLLNPAFELLGSSLAAQEYFDNSRAIDYLQTRQEIDPDRIGAYGFSGGGTQAAYLIGMDERVAAGCVGLFFSNRARTLETQGPSDGCQQISDEGCEQLELADFAIMNMPKPFLVLDGLYDFVDHWGALKAFEEVKKCYEVMGCADRVEQYYAEDGHATPEDVQQKTILFFQKWLLGKTDPLKPYQRGFWQGKEMLCTEKGQVNLEFADAQNTMQIAAALMDSRKADREAFLKGGREQIQKKLMDLLGLKGFNDEVTPVATGYSKGRGFEEYRFQLNCQGQMPVACVAMVPEVMTDDTPVEIHLSQRGKAWYLNDLAQRDYTNSGTILLAADFRGFGELEDPSLYNLDKYWNWDYRNAATSMHIGWPLIGQRVADMHTLLNFCAQDRLLKGRPIKVVADGAYAPVVIHSAILDDRISAAQLSHCVKSWRDYIEHPMQRDMLGNIVPKALNFYDLTDLVRLSKGKVSFAD